MKGSANMPLRLMKNLRRPLGAAWVALFFLGTALAAGCGDNGAVANEHATPQAPPAVKVAVEVVEPSPLKDVLLLPGETEAYHDVRLAAERDGRVDWIGPREGQTVKAGESVAKVDVEALKAALARARVSYELAGDLYKRRLALSKRGALPQEELERAKTELGVAENTLKEAQVHLEKGDIRSPIKGVVNKLFVDPGEWLSTGNPVADIVNVDRIKINVNVPELDVRYLKPGADVLVTLDAYPGERWLGKVEFVSYKGDPATKTFKVQVVVENPGARIRPGMIARAAFLKRMVPDALTAPLFAVIDRGGERLVFVEENGTAKARKVEFGVIDMDRVQITRGLKPGDHLIVTGHTEVEEGMRVEVR